VKDHRWLESQGVIMTILVTLVILIGGLVEIVPLFFVRASVPVIEGVKPYTPLELEGRDLYIREGCYLCHSQMIRPFRDETERYGPYSKAGEFIYDHPFQFGSKRNGPDLQRVGGKYPDSWHYVHLFDPRQTSPGSIMPRYFWLHENNLDTTYTQRKLHTMQMMGVPYTDLDVQNANQALHDQAEEIVARLKAGGVPDADSKKEIVAVIAYLQKLGSDIHWRENP
jgi:cytochrome c oxidase cbb3-type subunit I/II